MTQEPAAWIAFATDGSESSAAYSLYEQARAAADEWNWDVAPLYAARQATLTDAERDALEIAVEYVGSAYAVEHHATTILKLLERTK